MTASRNHERITNEANALQLVSDKTSIPVPRLLDHGAHPDGRRYLVTERIDGVTLDRFLGQDCSEIAYANALQFIQFTVLPQLEKLRSAVLAKPRRRASMQRPQTILENSPLEGARTLQVKALIDWEYAGFFPPGMQRWPGTLDQTAYKNRAGDMAGAIAEFLAEEYVECYEQWEDKAELEELVKRGVIPDPHALRQARAGNSLGG